MARASESPACSVLDRERALALNALGVRKAGTVHRVLHFPKDAQCPSDAETSWQAGLVALADPPLQVTVSSLGSRKHGMMPIQVTVLDDALKPVRNYRFDAFTQRGSRRSIAFHLDPANTPRFLLIEVDPANLGESESLVAGVSTMVIWAAGGVIGTMINGHEQHLEMPLVESGDIEVEFTRFDEEFHAR
jgi:hypothetical protein